MRTCSEEKKNKIKQTMAETKEKRKSQVCKVFPLKVVISHLNKSEQEIVNRQCKINKETIRLLYTYNVL